MPTAAKNEITREKLIDALNEDLSREYQAIIAYVNYSAVLKGAAYTDIARELEAHAGEELAHALTIAQQIDYLGGEITTIPKPVKTSVTCALSTSRKTTFPGPADRTSSTWEESASHPVFSRIVSISRRAMCAGRFESSTRALRATISPRSHRSNPESRGTGWM
jgi:rubrerythrin